MEDATEENSSTGDGAARKVVVRTLESGKSREESVLEDIFRLERRIFPKHESLAETLDKELQKRNVGVLYSLQDDYSDDKDCHPAENQKQSAKPRARAVAGYVMYSCSSLASSITKLAVRESCRRQGYAEALVNAAIEKARSKRVLCINLHVDPLRTPALNLYKKLGFEVDTLVHSYYAPSRDAYRMVQIWMNFEEVIKVAVSDGFEEGILQSLTVRVLSDTSERSFGNSLFLAKLRRQGAFNDLRVDLTLAVEGEMHANDYMVEFILELRMNWKLSFEKKIIS